MKPKDGRKINKLRLGRILKPKSLLKHNDGPDKDFKTFLSSKKNVEKFKLFLQSQYSSENIDFYLACEKFMNLDKDKVGREMIKFMANQIYNDFLGDNARQPVNINYECLQNIRWQIKNPHQNLFLDAQTEVFRLMEGDCYPRFCKSLKERKKRRKSKNNKVLS